jgi:hypothetical protein
MKILLLAAGCAFATAVVPSAGRFSRADAAESSPNSIQVVIWNRAGQPLDVEVLQGADRVFAGALREGAVSTSIEAGRILQREPGSYTIRIVDHTRGMQDSVALRMGPGGQNLGILLTQDGLAFVLTQGDVTDLTPSPQASGS